MNRKVGRTAARGLLVLALARGLESGAAEGVHGWWKGIVEEPVAGKPATRYPVTLSLLGAKGKTDYPTLGCGGELVLEKHSGDSSAYREHIRYGRDKCLDQTLITVTPTGVDGVQWSAVGGGITVSGYLFGPFELQMLEFDRAFRDQKLAAGSVRKDELASLPVDLQDCRVPTYYALSMLRTLLWRNYGQKVSMMVIPPGSVDFKDQLLRFNGMYIGGPPLGGIALAGNDIYLDFVNVHFEMSPDALAAADRKHPEWDIFRSFGEFALLVMVPGWDAGRQWLNANLGKPPAKTTYGACEVSLETLRPEEAGKRTVIPVRFTLSPKTN